MNDKDIKQEKQHLAETIEKLDGAQKTLNKTMASLGAANLEQLKEFRSSPETSGTDYMMFVQQMHEKNESFNVKDKIQRLEEIDYLMNEPYFARIDLADAAKDNSESAQSVAQVEPFYIGKFGYTEERPVIIDWRAKIASIYYRYRYPQKNVKYTTHEAEFVKDLTLKRTFEIDSGEFIKFYNNDLQLDEGSIIAGKIEERTGGVLEDIIETIQEEQMDIIEADPRKICIVQGSVGSGKSTVAIHKLSHIFFNHADFITPKMSILIAKSQVLVNYLATLFPKLGIFDIHYKTLNDLIINLIFREEIKITVDLHDASGLAEFTLKDIQNLEKALNAVHTNYSEKIKKTLSADGFESFDSFVYNKSQSVVTNIYELVSDLAEELDFQKEKYKDNPKSVKSWIFKENMDNIRKLTKKIQKLTAGLKDKVFFEVLKDLDVDIKHKLNLKNTLIYLYTYSEIYGFEKSVKYQYCVVDEGQDFSSLEYLVLGKLVQRGRFCILGDLNQSYLEEGLTTWDVIKEVIHDAKQAQTFGLTTNYRSTKQIIAFANKILSPFTQEFLPKSIERHGAEPTTIKSLEINDIVQDLKIKLSEELKGLNKSIGIIVFDDHLYKKTEEIFEELQNEHKVSADHFVKLAETSHANYVPKGVYLSKFEDCKGLEFAKVYILGLDLRKVETFLQAKKAFVAVTRAMNEVIIYE